MNPAANPTVVPILMRHALAWPRHTGAPEAVYADIVDALALEWPADAHLATYSCPGHPRRLSSEAVGRAETAGLAVALFVVDVDAPDHVASPEWLAGEAPKILALLAAHPGGYVYSTRGGYRIVYRLAVPHALAGPDDVRGWRAAYLGWLALVQRDFGIAGDTQCVDWTRLFRLPRVIRDGTAQIPAELGDPALGTGWTAEPLPVELDLADPVTAVFAGGGVPDEPTRAAAVRRLAAVWPATGRHSACLALGGGLAQLGWPPEAIAEFVACVMALGPGVERLDFGTEFTKQIKQAGDACARVAAGEHVAGWGSLAAIIGGEAADEVRAGLWVAPTILERARRELGRPPPPPPGSFREACANAYAEVVGALAAAVAGDADPVPLFEPVSAVLSREYAPTPWLVRGLVKRGGVLVVGGEAKTGKSWALTDVMVAVASAGRVFSSETADFRAGVPRADGAISPGRVFYLYAEDAAPDVKSHVRALCAGRGIDPKVLDGFAFVQPSGRFIDVTRPEDLALIVASVRWMGGADLVCLDPLRDVHSGEEDSSDSMREVMRSLRVIGVLLSEPGRPCTVATAHHTKKMEPGKAPGRGGNALRGSSAIFGALDGLISLSTPEGNGEDEIISRMECLVRGARSAGFFSLKLSITDDERGSAVSARWDVTKDTKEKREADKAAYEVGIEARVVARVRELRAAAQPTNKKAITLGTEGRNTEVLAAIERLLCRPLGDPNRLEERVLFDRAGRPLPGKNLVITAEET